MTDCQVVSAYLLGLLLLIAAGVTTLGLFIARWIGNS